MATTTRWHDARRSLSRSIYFRERCKETQNAQKVSRRLLPVCATWSQVLIRLQEQFKSEIWDASPVC